MASSCLRGLLAALLLCCLCLTAFAAPSPFRVLDYDTRVEIEKSGDILVTEAITIHVPTSGTNKGIIRDIPINPRWHEIGRQNVELEVLAVSIDGKNCPTDDIESYYPVLSIYMRDRTQYLDAGEHRFVLCYRMSEQVGFFEEGDELTWNAVGEGWDGGVQKARATVFPPPGTAFTQQRAWLDKRGAHGSPVRIRREVVDGREALVFEAERRIWEGEAFTIAVGWPSGIVDMPNIIRPEDQWGYTLFYAACFLFSLWAAWKLWVRYGRDPEAGAVIPLFYPPKVPQRLRAASTKAASQRKGKAQRLLHGEEYMTPVAVHYVHEGGKLEANGLAALFLSLAQRGDCKLSGNAKTGIVVEKVTDSSPAPEEHLAAGKLPDKLKLTPRKSTNSPIGKVYDACKLRLDFDYDMVVEWNIWPQLGLIFLLLLALVSAAFCQLGNNFSQLVFDALAEVSAALLMMVGGAAGAIFLTYDAKRNHAFSFKLLLLFSLCLFLSYVGYDKLRETEALWILSQLQWGLMVATLLPPILFGFFMDMPSREQVDLKQQIKGLALYIGTAETERFNAFNPPEEDLQLYHRLLPYAVALGLEAAWGKRFADKLAEAMAANEVPEMVCSTDFTFSLVRGSRSSLGSYREAVFAEQAAKMASYASNSGGGSSFRGFGGGAGSGGGGGGGRAC